MRCIDRQLQDSLATVLRQYPAIDAAFLFGSRAEGKAGPASDFDIALVGVRAELQAKKLDILAELVAAGFERTDLVLLDGADPFMQFEASLDMGCHIVADEGLGTVEQDRDIPRLFRENGFIDAELEQRWIRMIGFRNILVHEYLEVDRGIVYASCVTGLVTCPLSSRCLPGFSNRVCGPSCRSGSAAISGSSAGEYRTRGAPT